MNRFEKADGVWKKLEEYYNNIFGKNENTEGDTSSTDEE